jgi:hypothetical protein
VTAAAFDAPTYHRNSLSSEELSAFEAAAPRVAACGAAFPASFAAGDQIRAANYRSRGEPPSLTLSYSARAGWPSDEARRCVERVIAGVPARTSGAYYVVFDLR